MQLPPAYALESRDRVDAVAAEAARLAGAGAEEGTVIWAREQTAARDRTGRPRPAPPGNLYLAVLLRPELPAETAAQLGPVTALALGTAIAGAIPPLTVLRYRWPDEVLLNLARVATVALHPGPASDGAPAWLAAEISTNVALVPAGTGRVETSLAAEGCEDPGTEHLMESFCRHYLSWLDRWGRDGFDDVLARWRPSAEGIGEPVEVPLRDGTVSGILSEVDAAGGALVSGPGGERRRVTLAEFFGLA